MTSIYDIPITRIDGTIQTLAPWHGKALLIVNTASKCGFTPQYKGLETLYHDFSDRGLIVLGFPCNQFAAQESGNNDEISRFCKLTYDVTFPMFARIEVNGSKADPLFRLLKHEAPGLLGSEAIKWNFTKFLIDRDGRIVARFAPMTKPEALRRRITALLSGVKRLP